MWQNTNHRTMSKNAKAKIQEGNPIDVFYSQRVLGFEFYSNNSNYQVLIDTEQCHAKIEFSTGEIIDKNYEYYFEEDFTEDEEFELWLRSLLMSLEFFHSDVWKK